MRKIFSSYRVALCALCMFSLMGLRAYAQDNERVEGRLNGIVREEARTIERPNAPAPGNGAANEHPNGIVQDWSHHHSIYPRVGQIQSLIALQRDPRAIQSWQALSRRDWLRFNNLRNFHHNHSSVQLDWHINLGAAGMAPAMFPAKFTFDTTAVPICSTDFIVYSVNTTGAAIVPATGNTNSTTTVTITAGTIMPAAVGRVITGTGIPTGDTIASITPPAGPATSITLATAASATNSGVALTVQGQPNIVGFNNLYSGTAGSTGICNAPIAGRPNAADDDGVSATTIFSYNITAAGGKVPTSPALSMDGTKVAFVESASATTAHFHVLAYHSGDGVDAVDGGGLQNVLKPVTITSSFATLAPTAGAGTVTDLVLGSTSDTLSSPFVEYNSDLAYVGNDSGVLFRIKNVFCTVACTPGVSAAPSLDLSWPASGLTALTGTLNTGCSGKLTGPVVDFKTGNVFVGCADGRLFGFTPAGAAIPSSPLTVGTALGPFGGIVDPPLVDNVNGFVYSVAGNAGSGSGAPAVLVQTGTASFLTPTPVTAFLGAGGLINLHSPAFNDNYFTNATSSTWLLYAPAVNAGGTQSALYGIAFGAGPGRVMVSGTPTNVDNFGFGLDEFSPATEFLSSAAPAEDRLFESALGNFGGNLASFNISGAFAGGLEHFFNAGATGTSGIVVDNASSLGQADSIYYGDLSAHTAVKLTQSTLQ